MYRLGSNLAHVYWHVEGIKVNEVLELPESEISLSEDFRSARLSETGSSLLIRSSQHDYQFSLPSNELNAAFALKLDERMECYFYKMVFNAETGEAGIDLDVFYGLYDKPLDNDARSALTQLGFSPSPVNIIVPKAEGPDRFNARRNNEEY